jgi:hypothetical protein
MAASHLGPLTLTPGYRLRILYRTVADEVLSIGERHTSNGRLPRARKQPHQRNSTCSPLACSTLARPTQ